MYAGIRAICFFYVESEKERWRKEFVELFNSSIKVDNKYLGVCFGKYSRVVDSYQRSSKIVSYNLSRFVEKLTNQGIHCSPSLVLCKPLCPSRPEIIDQFPIRAYTFYKPKSCESFISGLSSKLNNTSRPGSIYSESFWNNSSYPLVEITYGDNYDSVINYIRASRKESPWATDSSTVFSLRIDLNTADVVKDKDCNSIPSVLFFKSANFSNIDGINLRKSEIKSLGWANSMERFGWFDVSDSFVFTSLYAVYKFIQKIKEKEKGNISSVATLLLREMK